MNFAGELDASEGFADIFKVVKSAVEMTSGRRRIGLSLGIADLPKYIGAYHQVGSNFIIMNRRLLDIVMDSDNKELINAYIFNILLHEYIHSFGYVNERETKALCYAISEEVLGDNHLATKIARYGIGLLFSHMPKVGFGDRENIEHGEIEIVNDFENDNLDYFG